MARPRNIRLSLTMSRGMLILCINIGLLHSEAVRERTIDDFFMYCPHTKTCSSTVPEPYNYNTFRPCCLQCNCTDGCGVDCCPDGPSPFLTAEQVWPLHLQRCVEPSYPEKEPLGGIYMVAACYHNTDTVAQRCMRSYNDFDFENESPEYFVPVSVLDDSIPYRNKYCAICNGIDGEDFVLWDTELRCQKKENINIDTFENVPGAIQSRNDCHIEFLPPEGFTSQRCRSLTDRCNQTGLWQNYDFRIETACLSYESLFTFDDGLYRNVHCYLCNNKESSLPSLCDKDGGKYAPGDPPVYKLTQLLNFREGPPTDTSCPTGELSFVNNEQEHECLTLRCAKGMLVDHEESICVWHLLRLFQQTVPFIVNFKLMPKDGWAIDFVSMEEIHHTFQDNLHYVFEFVEATSLCLFSANIVLNDNIETVVNEMSFDENVNVWNYVKYLDIRLEFITEDFDADETVDFFSVFAETGLGFLGPYMTYFKIEYVAIGTYVPYFQNVNVFSNISLTISELHLSVYVRDRLGKNGYNNDNGFGVIPFWWLPSNECTLLNSIELWPKHSVPRILIKSSDTERLIYFLSPTGNVSANSDCPVITAYDDAGILVCYPDFLDAFETEESAELSISDNIFGWLSFACICLSVVSLTLTLIVYGVLPVLRTLPGLNNMALVTSLLLYHILILVSKRALEIAPWFCTFCGIAVHFFILEQAFWMFICTLHVARVFNTRSCNSSTMNVKRPFVRYVISSAVLSSSIVATNVVVSLVRSNGNDIGYAFSPCYVRRAEMILCTVAAPLGIVILANIAMFSFTFIKLCRLPTLSKTSNQNCEKMKILAKLSVIMGASWVFGYLEQLTDVELFGYIFIILNAGIGVLIFVSFVLTRRVWSLLKELTTAVITSWTSQKTLTKSRSDAAEN